MSLLKNFKSNAAATNYIKSYDDVPFVTYTASLYCKLITLRIYFH